MEGREERGGPVRHRPCWAVTAEQPSPSAANSLCPVTDLAQPVLGCGSQPPSWRARMSLCALLPFENWPCLSARTPRVRAWCSHPQATAPGSSSGTSGTWSWTSALHHVTVSVLWRSTRETALSAGQRNHHGKQLLDHPTSFRNVLELVFKW